MVQRGPTSGDTWFDVDRKGLAALLEQRGKAFAIFELIQNAWDADGTTRVDVTLEQLDGKARWRLRVGDDAPDGFTDLTHAYRMFAPSEKKADPTKRGRFNLGEKLVLAICESAVVTSTTGGVRFTREGKRVAIKDRNPRGSVFDGVIQITKAEAEQALREARRLIPPRGIDTWVNADLLPTRVPVLSFEESMPTVVADEDGVLRPRIRLTTVTLYDPEEGEDPAIYEMGIPVVDFDDKWSVDVSQKVPLSLDRDNVPPGYLRRLRTAVANRTAEMLTNEDTKATWVNEALADERIEPEAVRDIITTRFGDNAVIYDPSDREANKLAMAEGRPVIHGSSLSKDAWQNVRRANEAVEHDGGDPFLLPAGRVTPSPHLAMGEKPPLPEAEWSDGMRRTAEYARELALAVDVGPIDVVWIEAARTQLGGGCDAAFGRGTLTLSRQSVGHDPEQGRLDELLIHEFAHAYSLDHFDSRFLNACCRIGARMVGLAMEGRLPRRVVEGRMAAGSV